MKNRKKNDQKTPPSGFIVFLLSWSNESTALKGCLELPPGTRDCRQLSLDGCKSVGESRAARNV